MGLFGKDWKKAEQQLDATALPKESAFVETHEIEILYEKLENIVQAPGEHEHKAIIEFQEQAKKIQNTKREAQKRILFAIKHIRNMSGNDLLAPEDLNKFEQTWEEFETANKVLMKHTRTYSLCIKIFINAFIHEVQNLQQVPVNEIIERVQKEKSYIIDLEEQMKHAMSDVYSEMKKLSELCHGEVEKFVQIGAVSQVAGYRVAVVQGLADFVDAYEHMTGVEAETFTLVRKFMKKHKKDFQQTDMLASKEYMKRHISMSKIKYHWVRYEPLAWIFSGISILANIAIFTSLGVVFGVGGKYIQKFSSIFFGPQLSAATYAYSKLGNLKRLSEDIA